MPGPYTKARLEWGLIEVPTRYTSEFLRRVMAFLISHEEFAMYELLGIEGLQIGYGLASNKAINIVLMLDGHTRDSARTWLYARFGAQLGAGILNLIPMGHDEKPRSSPIRKGVRRRLR